jgi:hypothetical protein
MSVQKWLSTYQIIAQSGGNGRTRRPKRASATVSAVHERRLFAPPCTW